jgi:protein-S-isoprenylcysteine O-methyltransferase Ste14
MGTSGAFHQEPAQGVRIPRWSAPLLLIGGTLAVHVALPWAISLVAPRYGWAKGRPGLWNLIGLIPVAAGLGMIGWGGSLHFGAATGGWELQRTPRYMLVKGPYRFSRNPMYSFELAMWLGWVIFYGSIAVLIAFVMWWIVFALIIVPDEERRLEARFGERYLQYKSTVPRWFRLPQRS